MFCKVYMFVLFLATTWFACSMLGWLGIIVAVLAVYTPLVALSQPLLTVGGIMFLLTGEFPFMEEMPATGAVFALIGVQCGALFFGREIFVPNRVVDFPQI